jgi:hypothetical protein
LRRYRRITSPNAASGQAERVGEPGFTPNQVIPGYFSRNHGRLIEIDGVCFREGGG